MSTIDKTVYCCIITNAEGVIFMSFKYKLRIKQQRKSDERKRERKRLKKFRMEKAKKKKLKISELCVLERPELPEKVIVEEVVKNGGIEGIISVDFDEKVFSVDVKNISLKKMIYSVDMGEERCAILEGFNKIILLNRKRITSTLASAI